MEPLIIKEPLYITGNPPISIHFYLSEYVSSQNIQILDSNNTNEVLSCVGCGYGIHTFFHLKGQSNATHVVQHVVVIAVSIITWKITTILIQSIVLIVICRNYRIT